MSLFLILVFSQYGFAKVVVHDEVNSESNFRLHLDYSGIAYKLHENELTIIMDTNKIKKDTPPASATIAYKIHKVLVDHIITSSKNIVLSETLQIIPRAYRDFPNLNEIHVSVYLIHQDIYGNDQKDLCFSFDMNKELKDKINWLRFERDNAPKVFPNLKYTTSSWFQDALNAEEKIPW